MPITAYTGVPGSGKSYALVEQVIVPGVAAGRRVLTNVDGLDPQRVQDYCALKFPDNEIGEVVLFDGRTDPLRPDFFPTESKPDTGTIVKGGDLLVFDEWRLTFPNRGAVPNLDLEPFLRWARHLVNDKGVACDIAIGTQLISDVHRDFRGLVDSSYKFRKLKSVGMPSAYAWDVYEGHLQPKNGSYQKGNGKYKKEIFDLYKSYDTDAQGTELSTDGRRGIFGKWLYGAGCGLLLMLMGGGYGMYLFFQPEPPPPPPPVPRDALGKPLPAAVPPKSPWRIVGHVSSDVGTRVILTDGTSLRIEMPEGFQFDGERPVSGMVEGQTVRSEERVQVEVNPIFSQ